MQFTQAKMHRINKVYYLNDTATAFSDHCKYLGIITLQSYLKWDKHINKIVNASSTLKLVRRNIKSPSTNISGLAYKTLVRPKLEYASIASCYPGRTISLMP